MRHNTLKQMRVSECVFCENVSVYLWSESVELSCVCRALAQVLLSVTHDKFSLIKNINEDVNSERF